MDGDGDQDLLYAGTEAGKVAWYENRDGKGSFTAEHVVSLQAGYCQDVLAADLDRDGDLDVVSVGNSGVVAWYENVDGLGTFGSQLVLRDFPDVSGRPSIRAADLDDDGDLDVVSSSRYAPLVWFATTDGEGNFGPEQIIGSGGNVQYLADLDGDGDLDVLSTSGSTNISWWENTDGSGHFAGRMISTSTSGVDPRVQSTWMVMAIWTCSLPRSSKTRLAGVKTQMGGAALAHSVSLHARVTGPCPSSRAI